MKACLILFTLFFSLATWSDCGNDYNCYYREMARDQERQKQQELEAQEAYRNEQIQLEQRQLEEVQEQNELLDKQLELQEEENQAVLPEESVTEPL